MKHIDVTKIVEPEFYMEDQGRDVRIAIARVNDFVQTMGDAGFSLIYSDKNEHETSDEIELNIVRRFHLRHAIIDLNNSFDLLLQIPWLYYRYWMNYNTTGRYYNSRNCGRDIVRNSGDWVNEVLERCNPNKVIRCLKHSSISDMNIFGNELEKFLDDYIYNETKAFTIRSLANNMKHKSAIRFSELNEPYTFNINTPLGVINPQRHNLEVVMDIGFWNKNNAGNEENPDGYIKVKYSDDMYLDVDYNNGEKFRSVDYLNKGGIYRLEEVSNECLEFHDKIIDLFDMLFTYIESNISLSPLLKIPNRSDASSSINMDKYFKVMDTNNNQ